MARQKPLGMLKNMLFTKPYGAVNERTQVKINKCLRLNESKSMRIIKGAGFLVLITTMITAAIAPLSTLQSAAAQFLPSPTPTPTTAVTPSPNATSTTTGAAGTTDLGPLKVEVLLFGVDKKPGQVVTFVTANNVTKAFGGNSAELDRADNVTDGIAGVFFTFPEVIPSVGDKFEACSIVLEDRSLMCGEGFKSPTNVTETVQLLVSDEGSALE